MKIKKLFSIALGASALLSTQAKELTLAKDGKTDYQIVIAAKPAKQVKYAAEEMSKFLKSGSFIKGNCPRWTFLQTTKYCCKHKEKHQLPRK